jgi:hypothetical protein
MALRPILSRWFAVSRRSDSIRLLFNSSSFMSVVSFSGWQSPPEKSGKEYGYKNCEVFIRNHLSPNQKSYRQEDDNQQDEEVARGQLRG